MSYYAAYSAVDMQEKAQRDEEQRRREEEDRRKKAFGAIDSSRSQLMNNQSAMESLAALAKNRSSLPLSAPQQAPERPVTVQPGSDTRFAPGEDVEYQGYTYKIKNTNPQSGVAVLEDNNQKLLQAPISQVKPVSGSVNPTIVNMQRDSTPTTTFSPEKDVVLRDQNQFDEYMSQKRGEIKSPESIYEENKLTSEYSDIPEVKNWLNTRRVLDESKTSNETMNQFRKDAEETVNHLENLYGSDHPLVIATRFAAKQDPKGFMETIRSDVSGIGREKEVGKIKTENEMGLNNQKFGLNMLENEQKSRLSKEEENQKFLHQQALYANKTDLQDFNPEDIAEGSTEYKFAQMIANGDMEGNDLKTYYPARLGNLGKNKRAAIMGLAFKLNPDLNPIDISLQKKWATNPGAVRTIAAANNALSNIDDAIKVSDLWVRSGSPAANKFLSEAQYQIGNSTVTSLRSLQTAVGDEIAGVLGYGSSSDLKTKLGLDLMDPNISAENFRSNMEIVKQLLSNRAKTMAEPMGKFGSYTNPGLEKNTKKLGGATTGTGSGNKIESGNYIWDSKTRKLIKQ